MCPREIRPFWKLLQEFDFIDALALAKDDEVRIMEPRLNSFDQFLKNEIKLERYQTMSHGALSVFRRIIGHLENTDDKDKETLVCSLSCQDLRIRSIPNFEDALKEIEASQIIPYKDQVFEVVPDKVHELYMYHSIIKNFDYSAIYTD